MTEENILRALRTQAWERAKGELRSVAVTFFGAESSITGQFEAYTETMEKFVAEVEEQGLAE